MSRSVGTCAHDRRALQQLALNVHVKHSDVTNKNVEYLCILRSSPAGSCRHCAACPNTQEDFFYIGSGRGLGGIHSRTSRFSYCRPEGKMFLRPYFSIY